MYLLFRIISLGEVLDKLVYVQNVLLAEDLFCFGFFCCLFFCHVGVNMFVINITVVLLTVKLHMFRMITLIKLS